MSAAQDEAWYVYAVLPAGRETLLVSPAVLAGSTIATIQEGALAALVSLVPRAMFAADHAACRATDPGWVAGCAAAHHQVVQLASSSGPCLPLGFGTLFTTDLALRMWLATNAPRMHRALDLLTDRQEWAVSLSEDPSAHAEWLKTHDPEVRRLAQAAAAAPPGTGFLLERRLAKALDAARATHGAQIGAIVTERLQAEHGLVRPEAARHGSAWSVLAPRDSPVASYIEELGTALIAGTGLTLRVTGPWPPYAFARTAWEAQAHA
jgi:hypothetical protein